MINDRLSIAKCHELAPELCQISDKEVEKLRDNMYNIVEFALKTTKNGLFIGHSNKPFVEKTF